MARLQYQYSNNVLYLKFQQQQFSMIQANIKFNKFSESKKLLQLLKHA